MDSPIRPLIILLVALAGLLFAYAILQAGINTLNGTGTLHSFFSNAVIIIAGILSTNFGAVLGVTLSPPKPAAPHSAKFLGLRPSIQTDEKTVQANQTDNAQKFQIIACWVYVGGLLIATLFYLIAIGKKIPDEKIVSVLTELSKTLIGVFVGVLTVALGRNSS